MHIHNYATWFMIGAFFGIGITYSGHAVVDELNARKIAALSVSAATNEAMLKALELENEKLTTHKFKLGYNTHAN